MKSHKQNQKVCVTSHLKCISPYAKFEWDKLRTHYSNYLQVKVIVLLSNNTNDFRATKKNLFTKCIRN